MSSTRHLHIGKQPLPLRITPAGGSHRVKVTLPADELLNLECSEIRIGWKLKKKNAEGAAVVITMLVGIVLQVERIALEN